MDGDAVVFDAVTASRVLKGTRAIESLTTDPKQSRVKPSFSIVQVVVPRSGPDANGFYIGELYTYDAQDDTYTSVASDILIKPLPATL